MACSTFPHETQCQHAMVPHNKIKRRPKEEGVFKCVFDSYLDNHKNDLTNYTLPSQSPRTPVMSKLGLLLLWVEARSWGELPCWEGWQG